MAAPERFADRSDSPCTAGAVHTWPIATNFSLAPDVSFWDEAEVGRAAEPVASVENDPFVWSDRALQENFADLAGAVLHQCIRPLIGA